MDKSFEEQLIAELQRTYEENDVNVKQQRITQLMQGIKNYMEQINSGHYRKSGYGKIFVTHFKNFTVSLLFGKESRNNGSGCLVRLNKDLLITNAHVVRGAWNEDYIHIGKEEIEVKELQERIISIDDDLDLAVIDMSDSLGEALMDSGKMFFEPNEWPAKDSQIGDLVHLAGFPGIFREDEIEYSTLFYTAIHDQVIDVTDRRILIEFNRKEWIKALGMKEISELKRLGGLSGGPVFIFRDDTPELVGFVFEEGGNFFDGVKVIKSKFINADGIIEK